jgi:hypothetical protein
MLTQQNVQNILLEYFFETVVIARRAPLRYNAARSQSVILLLVSPDWLRCYHLLSSSFPFRMNSRRAAGLRCECAKASARFTCGFG